MKGPPITKTFMKESNDGSPASVGEYARGSRKAEAQVMDLKAGETLASQQVSDGGKEPAVSPDATSQEERLEFLKQAIAFTEWTIRSFDSKAQISIGAFVVSINSLWSILSSGWRACALVSLLAYLLRIIV